MTKSFQTVFKTWKETRSIAVKEWKSWIFFMAIFVNQISRLLGKYVTNWLKFAQVQNSWTWSTLSNFFFSRVNLQNDANAVIVIFLHSNKPFEKIVTCQVNVFFLISTFYPTRSYERTERSLKCLTYLLRFLRDIFRNSRITILCLLLSQLTDRIKFLKIHEFAKTSKTENLTNRIYERLIWIILHFIFHTLSHISQIVKN